MIGLMMYERFYMRKEICVVNGIENGGKKNYAGCLLECIKKVSIFGLIVLIIWFLLLYIVRRENLRSMKFMHDRCCM